jgi:hypothetical protein
VAAEYEAPLEDERNGIIMAALYLIRILIAREKGANATDDLPLF